MRGQIHNIRNNMTKSNSTTSGGHNNVMVFPCWESPLRCNIVSSNTNNNCNNNRSSSSVSNHDAIHLSLSSTNHTLTPATNEQRRDDDDVDVDDKQQRHYMVTRERLKPGRLEDQWYLIPVRTTQQPNNNATTSSSNNVQRNQYDDHHYRSNEDLYEHHQHEPLTSSEKINAEHDNESSLREDDDPIVQASSSSSYSCYLIMSRKDGHFLSSSLSLSPSNRHNINDDIYNEIQTVTTVQYCSNSSPISNSSSSNSSSDHHPKNEEINKNRKNVKKKDNNGIFGWMMNNNHKEAEKENIISNDNISDDDDCNKNNEDEEGSIHKNTTTEIIDDDSSIHSSKNVNDETIDVVILSADSSMVPTDAAATTSSTTEQQQQSPPPPQQQKQQQQQQQGLFFRTTELWCIERHKRQRNSNTIESSSHYYRIFPIENTYQSMAGIGNSVGLLSHSTRSDDDDNDDESYDYDSALYNTEWKIDFLNGELGYLISSPMSIIMSSPSQVSSISKPHSSAVTSPMKSPFNTIMKTISADSDRDRNRSRHLCCNPMNGSLSFNGNYGCWEIWRFIDTDDDYVDHEEEEIHRSRIVWITSWITEPMNFLASDDRGNVYTTQDRYDPGTKWCIEKMASSRTTPTNSTISMHGDNSHHNNGSRQSLFMSDHHNNNHGIFIRSLIFHEYYLHRNVNGKISTQKMKRIRDDDSKVEAGTDNDGYYYWQIESANRGNFVLSMKHSVLDTTDSAEISSQEYRLCCYEEKKVEMISATSMHHLHHHDPTMEHWSLFPDPYNPRVISLQNCYTKEWLSSSSSLNPNNDVDKLHHGYVFMDQGNRDDTAQWMIQPLSNNDGNGGDGITFVSCDNLMTLAFRTDGTLYVTSEEDQVGCYDDNNNDNNNSIICVTWYLQPVLPTIVRNHHLITSIASAVVITALAPIEIIVLETSLIALTCAGVVGLGLVVMKSNNETIATGSGIILRDIISTIKRLQLNNDNDHQNNDKSLLSFNDSVLHTSSSSLTTSASSTKKSPPTITSNHHHYQQHDDPSLLMMEVIGHTTIQNNNGGSNRSITMIISGMYCRPQQRRIMDDGRRQRRKSVDSMMMIIPFEHRILCNPICAWRSW